MNTKQTKWPKKRLDVPVVIQMEAVECGAACLAMVLSYYGRLVALEEVRVECGVSRDGSNAGNVLKAARKYGLVADGYRDEPENLPGYDLPVILFWKMGHFVVLTGKKKNNYLINDPALGPRSVSEEEFDESFAGIVLTFKPGPDFTKGGVKRNMILSLLHRLSSTKAGLAYVFLAGFLLVAPNLLTPVFSKIFLDEVMVESRLAWIRPLLLAMFITMIVGVSLTWLQQLYLLCIELKLALTSSAKFLRHVFRLPMQFFYQRYAGDIQNRIYLNDKIAMLLSGPLSTNFIGMFLIIFYAALMFQYDVFLTVVSVSFALINFLALRFVSKKRTVLNQVLQVEQGKFVGNSMSGLQLIETIKASGSESDFFSKWAGYLAKVVTSQQKMDFSTLLLSAVPLALALFNTIAILTLGSLRILGGLLTIGLLSAYQMLMRNFSQPVNSMVDLGGQIQEIRGDLDRLDDVLNYREDEQLAQIEKAGAVSDNSRLEGCLELKNITFGYSTVSAPVIEGFSISLKPGERIALVGSSGCGKSTVARLIAGLYQPWEGEILFDGKSRVSYPKEVMHNSLSIVNQEIFLFRGMVRDNITMWDTTIDSSRIILAAKDAAIHNEISCREKGYDGIVEEGGVNFSGGQCQRIEIARALAINPSILILDEAMSSLDPAIEKVIDNNIRRRGCTCLIIAHRLSTIRDCNKIIVIEKGKIVESGTHEELIKARGHYHKLVTAG